MNMVVKSVKYIVVILLLMTTAEMISRTMPANMSISDDGRMLKLEAGTSEGLYDISEVKIIELQFEQSNWWDLLKQNYASSTDIPATLIYDDSTYLNVGVRFRGQTSYQNVQNSQKKSFNISIDYINDDQRIGGYKTLNLNNCYDDPTFMKEILYSALAGKHVPMFKANFVKLIINGENWGIYSNVQQLNREFYSDWFLSNDGTNWRAVIPDTSTLPRGPGGFVGFGTGFSSLNYLGSNPIIYSSYYTLKSHKVENPWDDLVTACHRLNTLPTNLLYDSLKHYIDVDRSLWHLATENIFTDDDGYINKGGMDYYIYYDIETNRLSPIIYDGNSTFLARKLNLSLFAKEGDVKYPLISKLMSNPQLKQRYVAHVRTILNDSFTEEKANTLIEYYDSLIETEVEADKKKIYSDALYRIRMTELRKFIKDRRNVLLQNAMVMEIPPSISAVNYTSNMGLNQAPKSGGVVNVTANVNSEFGVFKVILYYGTGLMGIFDKIEMFDDGNHNDGTAGDGIYGAAIPSFPAGTYVRYYIEALADNTFKTAAYSPEGAEHDVYFYQVQWLTARDSPVIINEFMASNSTTIADPQGEYDDWIELFNKSGSTIDLSGMYLSDKLDNPKKWRIPDNTILKAGEYLIIWADENGKATPGLHANFKLSADGEVIMFFNNDANSNELVDSVSFGPQETDVSYGRFPNGTGSFTKMVPTPGAFNQAPMTVDYVRELNFRFGDIYPNPFTESVSFSIDVELTGHYEISVYDSEGKKLCTLANEILSEGNHMFTWNIKDDFGDSISTGTYFINIKNEKNTISKAAIFIK